MAPSMPPPPASMGMSPGEPLVPMTQPESTGTSPDEIFAKFLTGIQEMVKSLEAMATAHPEAATEFKAATEAIKNSAAKVAASVSSTQQETVQPPVM